MDLDWKNIIATGLAAFAGGLGSYVLAAFFQSVDRIRRRVEDFEREWHAEDVRQSKDVLFPILANITAMSITDVEVALNHQVRHLERVLEVLRRMAVCWRDGEVHRHYFLRLLRHDAREWQRLFNRSEVPEGNY